MAIDTPRSSTFRNYFVFAIVSSGLTLISIDATIVTVALPTLLDELHSSLALISWTLTAYQLTYTIGLPLSGRIADRWGRKRVFMFAVVLFAVSSAGAGMAPSVYVLILFRILQGCAAGMFFPSAAGMVADVFQENRQTPIGLFVTIFQIGGIVGPNVGGIITDNLSWRWIFFVNLPLCLAIILLGIPFLPKDKERDGEAISMDTSGALLFASGMFSLLFSLTNMANHPNDLLSPVSVVSLICGLTLMGLFLVNEIKARHPVVDLELLRWRPFAASNAQIFMNNGAFNAFFNFIPYYATIAYGFSATKAGAILTPRSIAAVIVSLIMSVILRITGYRKPWLLGIYLLSGAVFFTAIAPHNVDVLGLHLSGFVFLSAILFMGGVGVGVSAPPSQNANFDLVPDNIAAAAGLRAMFANSGSILGTTAVTLALSRYHDKVHGMQHIFLALAAVVFASQVLVFMVPEMRRDRHAPADEPIAVPIE